MKWLPLFRRDAKLLVQEMERQREQLIYVIQYRYEEFFSGEEDTLESLRDRYNQAIAILKETI